MTDKVRLAFHEAYAGPVTFPPLAVAEGTADAEPERWRTILADALYGSVPPPPEALHLERHMLPSGAERLVLTLQLSAGELQVDAALFRPTTRGSLPASGPSPLICGLDFIGLAGLLTDTTFPLDPRAIVLPRPELGACDGRLSDTHRGTSAGSWPIPLLTGAGFAVLVSCYGSWVPDNATAYPSIGVKSLIREPCGAISLWAWALSRLIDAAATLPDINTDGVVVAGHSRLGKAALWAAANDQRIVATFANNSGAAGAAPRCHPVGETLAQLRNRFPHWLRPDAALDAEGVDQHLLLAALAPRALYLAEAAGDLWADPMGSYMALAAASRAWPEGGWPEGAPHIWPTPRTVWDENGQVMNGPLGYHLRPGGHALLPHDWRMFLRFLGQVPAVPHRRSVEAS